MKHITLLFFVTLFFTLSITAESSADIRINSLGYPLKAVKKAVVTASAESC